MTNLDWAIILVAGTVGTLIDQKIAWIILAGLGLAKLLKLF